MKYQPKFGQNWPEIKMLYLLQEKMEDNRSYSSHKISAAIVLDFGKGRFGCGRGGRGYDVTVLTMEAVGDGGGVQVEGFGGGGKGERNRRHQDGQQWDIALVLLYLFTPFLSPLSCGVNRKLTLRLQVLGWIYTELPPTLISGTGSSSSVRHHGTNSILGVE